VSGLISHRGLAFHAALAAGLAVAAVMAVVVLLAAAAGGYPAVRRSGLRPAVQLVAGVAAGWGVVLLGSAATLLIWARWLR
jgi:hypothetical protein